MGTVVRFDASLRRDRRGSAREAGATGEIVIFPGVRIERHHVDLGHRLLDSAGRGGFDGIGETGRPRKSSWGVNS